MDLSTLQHFRHDVYACFRRAKDALFNTVDALITETQAQSFPELSFSPSFERQWHSLYEAFEDGKIDQKRLQSVFLAYLPPASVGKRVIYGLDATQIERPVSSTSPHRTAMPMHNIPHAVPKKSTPITFGWKYSTMTVLPNETSSWSYIMDQRRIPSDKTDIQVAFEQ